jgi:gamma-glutamyltranspeptidase/glutathione hydrolase
LAGLVAAGHPLTAEAGAAVLRDGGTAVDAAVAAMLVSWTAEPLLTGPGAGGYLLVAGPGEEPVLLDFFVEAPGRGCSVPSGGLTPITVSFGDAVQVFHVGGASVGVYGCPAGVCAAMERWGTVPLAELCASAADVARAGVRVNATQAYLFELLDGILRSTPGVEALFAPGGVVLREGDLFASPELAATIELLGAEGAAPFYTGAVASAAVEAVGGAGGTLTREDLAAYAAVARAPLAVGYRGRTVLTNPPPSAGGTLLGLSLALLDEGSAVGAPPSAVELVAAMRAAQDERTPGFVAGLDEEGFADRFLSSRLGSTTHISVVDGAGRACSVTCTNGEGAGIVIPGTGIHLNNVMGEEDLNPLGFHAFPPGRRMPSMMAPTVVLSRAGDVELVVGSAGSNRIRSAILQTIVGVVDHGLDAVAAVQAPRLHFEDGLVYTEPGIDEAALHAAGLTLSPFRAPNLFFGGAQAVRRSADGSLSGAGDPRRGGAVAAG